MISLNGKQFAATAGEFTESLFHPGGTCSGFYKAGKNKVELFNMRRELIGAINRHGLLCQATKQPDGRFWYSFGTIPEIGEYPGFAESISEPAAVFRQLCRA